jgi:ABC-type sugar transport system ATPase subunit
MAGLVGAGRTSAALAIAGALPFTGGIALQGVPATFSCPADAIARGISYVTEDRKARGIIPQMETGANITLSALKMLARGGLLSPARERMAADAAARRFDVRAASLRQPVSTLSGGNQQKVLLARSTLRNPLVLLLDEPTRGVDVGARADIYALMNDLTRQGLAIVMISSDLPEVLGMSDRIVVMREGRTRGELTRLEATPERVMALATAA